MVQGQGAKTIKKNTNSTQNKSQTHRAKQYEVTSFLSTDCELSTKTCSKNFIVLAPGHSPNKHRTNVLSRRPNWKEVGPMPNITWTERPTCGPARGPTVRHNQECEKNEVFLDSAHQRYQRRPMDIAFELCCYRRMLKIS